MEAFCFKCRGKHELLNPKPIFFANGSPATQGTCSNCGSEKVFKMGRTPEHEGLTPPIVERKPRVKKVKVASEAGGTTPKKGKTATKVAISTRPGGPLVIVESPTKAKTIGKFLGRNFMVRPSVGHIRDLPKSRLGVDVEHDFEPSYIVPMDKRKTVKELRELAKSATEIWLATDPDREGEAISWHLHQALETEIGDKPVHRVEFHEITQDAISKAFAEPRSVNMNRVDAQQARRILDRLVGYNLSPLVSDKLSKRGLSAGRVQSVALRLVVEREREILAFVPVEYWTIEAELEKIDHLRLTIDSPENRQSSMVNSKFRARLFKLRGLDPDLKNEADSQGIVDALEGAKYEVWKVERKDRQRKPAAPFTTSTLQQEASRKLGFNVRRAMGVAQSLYEGVDVGEGNVGLITYMRTDSVNVAEVAQQEARSFIDERYGKDFRPDAFPRYANRSKNAQEAHEAVRPTSVYRTPESIKEFLEPEQYRLYDLIWKRFVASQMANAIFDATTVDIDAQTAAPRIANLTSPDQPEIPVFWFRATGSIIKFAGFLRVYEEGRDDGDRNEENEGLENSGDRRLPPLEANEPLNLIQLLPEQHFTQPPPRYTEASLVKALEEYGIGRPSTYAAIMSTIQTRNYVRKEGKQLRPTELGFDVNDLLVGNFPIYIDVGFTAHVEDELDQIETGTRRWQPVLHEFYDPFKRNVTEATSTIEKRERVIEYVGEACPKCETHEPLVFRQSRTGRFIGCSSYPKCDYTAPLTIPGVRCPKCADGKLTERHMRKGNRVFYGCVNYPECDFTTWNRPLAMPAPDGSGGLVVLVGKNKAKVIPTDFEFELPDNALEVVG